METTEVKQKPATPGHPIRLKGLEGQSRITPEHPSKWRIYATLAGLRRAKTYFIKAGYKYIVAWRDTNGFGLEAEYRATWQNDSSPVHQDL